MAVSLGSSSHQLYGSGHDLDFYISQAVTEQPSLSCGDARLHEYKSHIPRMVNINATTPQLKVLQKCIDAYATLDISKIEPVLSKNYIHETFPKSIGLPGETKEEYIKRYIKRYEEMLSSFTMIEVRIQHRRIAVVRLAG